ncbi:hypothetical protein BpHYR1_031489 [Brachionus plicatilis]|uniref:Uncharacterized protein n=1 Tax=Brachionus plicatilis TaxID=10195 RepID=A0A3M7SPX3_BRAPC|nr:hypothetical protein BpHYR1_031489 [Brachionus plicatilis]
MPFYSFNLIVNKNPIFMRQIINNHFKWSRDFIFYSFDMADKIAEFMHAFLFDPKTVIKIRLVVLQKQIDREKRDFFVGIFKESPNSIERL